MPQAEPNLIYWNRETRNNNRVREELWIENKYTKWRWQHGTSARVFRWQQKYETKSEPPKSLPVKMGSQLMRGD